MWVAGFLCTNNSKLAEQACYSPFSLFVKQLPPGSLTRSAMPWPTPNLYLEFLARFGESQQFTTEAVLRTYMRQPCLHAITP